MYRLKKTGMEEVYLINRETRIAKSPDRLSITFRGNVTSIPAFIPFMLSCMTGVLARLTYVSNSSDFTNPTSHPNFYIPFAISSISILIALAQVTLKYEIIIDRKTFTRKVTRLNIKSPKVTPLSQIVAFEKAMVRGTIGDTGSTEVHWPHIRIREASTTYDIPVTLSENNVDDIIKLMQEFIADSNV
jgi:hypothetical protein